MPYQPLDRPTPAPAMSVEETDYRLMVDEIADYAIYRLDPSGFIRSWNTGARLLKGYDADEIIGHHFSLFYPPELLERNWPEEELRIAREQGRFQDEGWRVRKDGSRFWASVVITRLIDAEGRFHGFSKITRDITDRRQQEELLRASEERFRLLVEGVKDYAIFMLDPAGYVVSWNAGARHNKGYEASEIIGKHFSVFYPEDVAASGWPEAELKKALVDGRYEEEGWRVRKDGTRFWASVVITTLRDHSGRHRGFAKVTRDLTEKRRVEVLEDEGRRITAFVAMLAHELRNPLAPISNAVAILDLEPNLPPTVTMARDIVSRQLKQMTRLVDDLLDMSRITSGKIHLEDKPVLLDGIIAEALEAADPLLRANAHHVEIDLRDHNLWVSGDRTRLIQIVCNLLNNAAKFTPRNGRISITLMRSDDDATIAVKDNGPGIPAERLPTLFTRFMQREDDTSKTYGGLGLGLSLVQQLVTLQGGSVSASSTGIAGDGSEFIVHLPLIPALGETTAAKTEPERIILVVDDNQDSADTLALLLKTKGYQTRTAYSGHQALDAIRRELPKVVLLDIGLPDIDGIDVAKRLASEMHAPPPLIAVTGYGMDKDRERSFSAGFHAHLTKPVDPEKLDNMLRVLLA